MTTLTNSFEGGTNGTAITTANSGGTSGNAFDTVDGSPTFASGSAIHGSLGLSSPLSAASSVDVRWGASFSYGNQFYVRDYFMITSSPSAVIRLSQSMGSGAARWGVAVSSGVLAVRNLSSGVNIATCATTIPLSTPCRYELSAAYSGTAWTVTLNAYYGANVEGTTPSESVTSAAMTLGAVDTYSFGADATGSQTWAGVSHDDIGVSSTGYLGPVSTSTAVAGSDTAHATDAGEAVPATVPGSDSAHGTDAGESIVATAFVTGTDTASGTDAGEYLLASVSDARRWVG